MDLTLARGIQNTNINAFDPNTIKTRYTAIEIQIEDTNNLCPSTIPLLKNKNAERSRWKSYLDNVLSTYKIFFPETISQEVIDMQVNKLTEATVS